MKLVCVVVCLDFIGLIGEKKIYHSSIMVVKRESKLMFTQAYLSFR